MNRQLLSRKVTRPNYRDIKLCEFQTSGDIAKALRKAEFKSRVDSKKLASFFKSSTDEKTCYRVWCFLRENIIYERESKRRQTAKEINRFLYEGYGDCKHYTTFCVGVLNACGIPAFFSLISQKREYPNRPNHIYCVALIGNETIVVDGTKSKYGHESNYIKKWVFARKSKKKSNGTLLSKR